jgi:hypothetical protein
MNFSPPLLLAAGEIEMLVKLAAIILFLGLPTLARLFAKAKQVPPPGAPVGPKRPVPPQVADEIGEFLRRAAERRAGAPQPPQAAQPQATQPQPLPPREKPVLAEAVADVPIGTRVNEQVKSYLDTQSFGRREDALGKEVAQADQQIDQHLHQVFDHNLSRLETATGETAAPPTAAEPPELADAASLEVPATFATGLLALVTNPDSLQQAVILSEILHRPTERWE